jgi:hypothetical protein
MASRNAPAVIESRLNCWGVVCIIDAMLNSPVGDPVVMSEFRVGLEGGVAMMTPTGNSGLFATNIQLVILEEVDEISHKSSFLLRTVE